MKPIFSIKAMERDDLLDNLATTYRSGVVDLLREESYGLAVLVTVRDEFGRELTRNLN